mmetsp:Transcript_11480/g.17120  ORF Transcript_11480/g.17120 Transcript_11480/m.17120 type:complete len:739 (-) Transcript_11480:339-2555(-)
MVTSADRLMRALKDAQRRVENRKCADCPEKAPNYVNLEYRTFICQNCAAVHRDLFGPSKIKSVAMAVFTTDEVKAMRAGGNEHARKIWMARWTSGDDMDEPPVGASRAETRLFLEEKYLRKRWTSTGAPTSLPTPPPAPPRAQIQQSQVQQSQTQQSQIQQSQTPVQPPQQQQAHPSPQQQELKSVPSGKPRIQISMPQKNMTGVKKTSPAKGNLAPPTRAIGALRLVPPPGGGSTPTKAPETKATTDLFAATNTDDFFAVPTPAPAVEQSTSEDFFAAAKPSPGIDMFAQQGAAAPTTSENDFFATPQNPVSDPFAYSASPQQQNNPIFVESQSQASISLSNPFGGPPTNPAPGESTNPFDSAGTPALTSIPPVPVPMPSVPMSSVPQNASPPPQNGPQPGESCMLQQNGKYERVTVVSFGADGYHVRLSDGSTRIFDNQALVRLAPAPILFAVNDTAFYQVSSRVEICTIVEIHRDAPEDDPYYTVRLQATGKERTTDAPHLHKPLNPLNIGNSTQTLMPPPQQAGQSSITASPVDDDPFSELVGGDVAVTVNSTASERDSAFAVDERVDYIVKGSQTAPEPAIILKVHYDSGTQPYYTIRLLSTGAERQTDAERLTKPYQPFLPPQQQKQQHYQQQYPQQYPQQQSHLTSPPNNPNQFSHFHQQHPHFPHQQQYQPPPGAYNSGGQAWPQQQQQSYGYSQQQPYGYPQNQPYPSQVLPGNSSTPYSGGAAGYPPF